MSKSANKPHNPANEAERFTAGQAEIEAHEAAAQASEDELREMTEEVREQYEATLASQAGFPATQYDERLAAGAEAGADAEEGTRARRTLTTKQFLPGDKNWIRQNISNQDRGHHVSLGRLYGTVYKAEPCVNTYEGKQLTSIRLRGMFEAVVFASGEVISAGQCFIPLAFAEQIEAALSDGLTKSVEIDVDIGLEATGKDIPPYEWTVTSYLDGEAKRALRALRSRRVTRLALPAGQSQRQIAG